MKVIKRSLKLALLFVMVFMLSITVHADYDGDGGDKVGADGSSSGYGFISSRSGYRIYIAKDDGTVLRASNGNPYAIDLVASKPDGVTEENMSTRIGNVNSVGLAVGFPAGMPTPIGGDGNPFYGQGDKLADWMKQPCTIPEYQGYTNVNMILLGYFGVEAYNTFNESSDLNLIVEAVYWGGIFETGKGSSHQGRKYYGTAYNWLTKLGEIGYEDNGFLAVITNKVALNALYIENDYPNFGLYAPTNLAPDRGSGGYYNIWTPGIVNTGYGLHIYRSPGPKIKPIHTIGIHHTEENKKKPHEAEEPDSKKLNTGKTAIIKMYANINTVIDENGNVVKRNFGECTTHTQYQTSNLVVIEDEEDLNNYKLTAWMTTSNILGVDGYAEFDGNFTVQDWIYTDSKFKWGEGNFKKKGSMKRNHTTSGCTLMYSEDSPLKMDSGENTIFLLYIRSNEIHNIHTQIKTETKRHPSENPTAGKTSGMKQIVKVYGVEYVNSSGTVIDIQHEETFLRTGCTNRVIITDESSENGYRLIRWSTSEYKGNINVDTLDWIDEKNGTFKVKKAPTLSYKRSGASEYKSEKEPFKLHSTEKTLYVFYLRKANINSINTYDIDSSPTDSALCEEPNNEKMNFANKSIVKTYAIVYKDSQGKVLDIKNIPYSNTKNNFTRTNVSDRIVVHDEKNETGYSLQGYFTNNKTISEIKNANSLQATELLNANGELKSAAELKKAMNGREIIRRNERGTANHTPIDTKSKEGTTEIVLTKKASVTNSSVEDTERTLYLVYTKVINTEPIHSFDLDDKPIKPDYTEEVDIEKKRNFGEKSVIKVYGTLIKIDGKVVGITNNSGKNSFVTVGCSDRVIIQDEETLLKDKYKLTAWFTSSVSKKGVASTSFSVYDWVNEDGTLKTVGATEVNGKKIIRQKYIASDGTIQGNKGCNLKNESLPLTLNNSTNETTLFILYLNVQELESISTKDTNRDHEQVCPIKGEKINAYDTEAVTEKKKGTFKIKKMYGFLDNYNKKVIDSYTTETTGCINYVNIVNETEFKLVAWASLNEDIIGVTASKWLDEYNTLTGEDVVNKTKKFFGDKYVRVNSVPGKYYFNIGKDGKNEQVLYLLYIHDDSLDNTSNSEFEIPQSFISKKLRYSNNEVDIKNWLGEKVAESLKEHKFITEFSRLAPNTLESNYEINKADVYLALRANLLLNSSGKLNPGIIGGGNFLRLDSNYLSAKRTSLKPIRINFSNEGLSLVGYRAQDFITFPKYKIDSLNEAHKMKQAIATLHEGIGENYYKITNTVSNRLPTDEDGLKYKVVNTPSVSIDENTGKSDLKTSAKNKTSGEVQDSKGKYLKGSNLVLNQSLLVNTYSGTNKSGVPEDSIKFVPYISMNIQTLSQTAETYVNGKYVREMKLPNAANIEVTHSQRNAMNKVVGRGENNQGKMTISSNQWSTHQIPVNLLGETCVLPGGAILNLTVHKDSQAVVNVKNYAVILSGTGLTQVQSTVNSQDLTALSAVSTKLNENKDIASIVTSGLETLQVEQWLAKKEITDENYEPLKNITKSVWEMSDAKVVKADADTESKYYFRTYPNENDKDANAGDIDVIQGDTTVVYYTFFTNTHGDLLVKEGSDLSVVSNTTDLTGAKVLLNKAQDAGSLTGVYKTINDDTNVVTNLLESIERNTGNDNTAPWATSDGKWYNEAFDGITIARINTELRCGFLNVYERSCVLDVHLTPESTGKADMFKQYNLTQFKLKPYCEKYPSVIGKVGEYNGQDIIIENLDTLLISDMFYIPNVTVQDLK